MTAAARSFFFYGTLLDAEVRALVMGAGAPAAVETATLAGWRRITRPGATYPIVVRAPDDTVEGAIARALVPDAVSRLIAYEGAEYGTAAVEVRLADGRSAAAEMFVPSGEHAAGGRPWDLAAWQRRHKRRFIARLKAGAPA